MPQGKTRQHPIFRILRVDQGRSMAWLARQTGFSHGYVRDVSCGLQKGSPRFRAACAEVMAMPEAELFLRGDGHGGAASGAPKRRASRVGSAAGRGVYGLPVRTSTDDAVGGAVAS